MKSIAIDKVDIIEYNYICRRDMNLYPNERSRMKNTRKRLRPWVVFALGVVVGVVLGIFVGYPAIFAATHHMSFTEAWHGMFDVVTANGTQSFTVLLWQWLYNAFAI